MATVADIIRGAFRALGVLAAGETPSAAEEADALTILNDMLDSWANERLAVFQTVRTAYTLTPSLNPHTIGHSGHLHVTRPVRVDRASVIQASGAQRGAAAAPLVRCGVAAHPGQVHDGNALWPLGRGGLPA
jgi:hypothetical protein